MGGRWAKSNRSIAERFWELTCPEPNSGCILWTGAVARGPLRIVLRGG